MKASSTTMRTVFNFTYLYPLLYALKKAPYLSC